MILIDGIAIAGYRSFGSEIQKIEPLKKTKSHRFFRWIYIKTIVRVLIEKRDAAQGICTKEELLEKIQQIRIEQEAARS